MTLFSLLEDKVGPDVVKHTQELCHSKGATVHFLIRQGCQILPCIQH